LEVLVARVIAVDHFDPEELKPHYQKTNPANLGHNSRSQTGAAAE
jgi:acyl-CoA dehydrogenase